MRPDDMHQNVMSDGWHAQDTCLLYICVNCVRFRSCIVLRIIFFWGVTPRRVPEERCPQPHRCGNLITRCAVLFRHSQNAQLLHGYNS